MFLAYFEKIRAKNENFTKIMLFFWTIVTFSPHFLSKGSKRVCVKDRDCLKEYLPVVCSMRCYDIMNMLQADEEEPFTDNGPHVYTQPTLYRWVDVSTGVWDGRRVFDKSDVFPNNTEGEGPLIVKGGTHLTGTTLLPNAILKVSLIMHLGSLVLKIDN